MGGAERNDCADKKGSGARGGAGRGRDTYSVNIAARTPEGGHEVATETHGGRLRVL